MLQITLCAAICSWPKPRTQRVFWVSAASIQVTLFVMSLFLQVERIQNKLLYQNFDAQRRRIVNRWHSVEPNLNVQMRLWHGTGSSDPSEIYDSEEGELETATRY